MLRKFTVGVALAACTALALTACVKPAAEPVASVSLPPEPSEVLKAAVEKTLSTSFAFTYTDVYIPENNGKGFHDAKTASTEFVIDDGTNPAMVFAAFGNYVYFTQKGQTYRVDLKKLTGGSYITITVDVLTPLAFIGRSGTVNRTGTDTFEGTIDVTEPDLATTPAAKVVVKMLTKLTKPGVTAVPFTAAVDAQGRVSAFSVNFVGAGSKGKDLSLEYKVTDFDTTHKVVKPTKAVKEASQKTYDAYNTY